MNSTCLQQFLACQGGGGGGGGSPSEWTPVIIGTCTAVLAIWQYLLKLPAFQRALGAENKEKKEKLERIHSALSFGRSAPDSPSEKTPLRRSAD